MILKASKELKKLFNINILGIKNNQSRLFKTPSGALQALI